ncbi:hypothetical protein FRC04_002131 [Tulasnella sp. 424]|nr:hypothetical protein FRC04_002131 [Tulasnella sp. 424]
MITLSRHLGEFSEHLISIPEFLDERLTESLLGFQGYLHHRAERIAAHLQYSFMGKLTIFQYIEQVMKEMLRHVSSIGAALSKFVRNGVTAIQNAQMKSQDRLQNMSTVATFLSAVTASAMTYDMSQEHLKTVAMGLWISSLILSITSAINAQLAMHLVASICLDHTPLLCLIGSVIAFSAGLVVFTFAAKLALPVKIWVGIMTGVTSLVLIAAIIWELVEWWRQDYGAAEENPGDSEPLLGTPVPQHPWIPWKSTKKLGAEARDRLWAGTLTVAVTLRQSWRRLITGPSKTDQSGLDGHGHNLEDVHTSMEGSGRNDSTGQNLVSTTFLTPDSFDESHKSDPSDRTPASPNRSKFQNAAHALAKDEKLREIVSALSQEGHCVSRRDELKHLRPVRRLRIFHAAGEDIHFSPDGTRLAVSGVDESLAIWEVGKYHEKLQTIPCPVGRFAWSPDSSHIVIMEKDGLAVWNNDSGLKVRKTEKPVGVVAWLQSSSDFIAVIDNVLHIFDKQGRDACIVPAELPLRVHDVASIMHQKPAPYGFVLVVGTFRDEDPMGDSISSAKKDGKRPSGSFAERWLMGKLIQGLRV